MDLKQRAQDIREEIGRLKGGPSSPMYVVSLKRRDKHQTEGRVFIVPGHMAAKLVVDGTHDYAKPEQIQAYETDQAAIGQAIRTEQAKSEQKFVLNISDDMIARAVASQAAASQK